jgi:hypothetical protein
MQDELRNISAMAYLIKEKQDKIIQNPDTTTGKK